MRYHFVGPCVPDCLRAFLWPLQSHLHQGKSVCHLIPEGHDSTATGAPLTGHFRLIWPMWRNRDEKVTYIVLPSLLSPSAQTALGREICITKGLSWHTLVGVIVRAAVSRTADLEPVAGSAAAGAMGKAWVSEGKCHQFHRVGRRNTQTILREAINAPSVSGRLRHCELRQPQDGTKCLTERKSCCVSLVVMAMTSFLRGTDLNLRGSHWLIQFSKDTPHSCSRNVVSCIQRRGD